MQDDKELVFLYTVNPRKVITGLSGVNAIRTAKSLFLTKEDVKICLQKATVYRRFANEGINERVNVGNIDRLHRENYVSEKDWDSVHAKEMSEGHGKVEVPTEDHDKVINENLEPVIEVPTESSDLTKNANEEVAAPVVSNIETAQNEDEENKQTRAILDETKADDNEIESDDDDEVTVADVDEKEILK